MVFISTLSDFLGCLLKRHGFHLVEDLDGSVLEIVRTDLALVLLSICVRMLLLTNF